MAHMQAQSEGNRKVGHATLFSGGDGLLTLFAPPRAKGKLKILITSVQCHLNEVSLFLGNLNRNIILKNAGGLLNTGGAACRQLTAQSPIASLKKRL